MDVLIGVGASVLTFALIGAIKWFLKRFSVKTKTDEAVTELREQVDALKEQVENNRLVAEHANAMRAQVEEVHAAIKPMVKSVFGLLLKAKEGKVNGEIEDALKEVKNYLGI